MGAFLFGFVELMGNEGRILPEQKILVANGELDRIVIRDDPELNATETETYITVADLDHFSCAGASQVLFYATSDGYCTFNETSDIYGLKVHVSGLSTHKLLERSLSTIIAIMFECDDVSMGKELLRNQ
jgi:hypothetical protein